MSRVRVRAAFVCLVVAAWLLALSTASFAQTGGERIRNYQVWIDIQRNGELVVTEVIDYDFGLSKHHGIFRDIPVRFHFDDRYDRVTPLTVLGVQGSPGTPDGYKVEHVGSVLRIRIGDPNRTITGRHTYRITYRVEGALNGFPDHDELYWNAIGAFWDVPIDVAQVMVTAPTGVKRVACFAGPSESRLPCSAATGHDTTADFAQASLSPRQGLTVVVGFPAGVVPTPRPILKERWAFRRAFAVTRLTGGVAGALLLFMLVAVGRLLWVTGRDRRAIGSAVDVAFGTSQNGEQAVPLAEHPTIPVEYAPPEGIRPGQVGTLIDEVANPLDVTSTIVDLAVRGYLRIEEIPKERFFGKPDWTLVRLKQSDGDLLPYEQRLHDGLFEDADGDGTVKLSSLKRKFQPRLRRVQDALYDDVVKEGWFAGRPDTVRRRWRAAGFVLLGAGVALTWVAARYTHLGLIPLPVALAGLALTWGAHTMPRRTAKGTGLVRRVFGFRRYIETAEKQEARFQEKENLFSKYLPYAIVFGATEKWARAFAGLDRGSGTVPSTLGWYVGTQPFGVDGFASSIEHFSSITAGMIASAASGSSGFGGGGVGGGGGGGGGGSW